jgi:RimJ/RimL family protein N-acetyltransferase
MKKKIDPSELPTIPSLVGKNVYLRPAEAEDYTLTYQWFLATDPQSQTCHQTMLFTPGDYGKRMQNREAARDAGDFIIVRIEDDQPVGKLRYFHLNMLNRSAELAYIVAPDQHRKGYADEGMRLLIGYLFAQLNLNKVYAQTASFNKASIKLLESLDFKLDGTLRQHHYFKGDLYDDLIYSLLRFEYGN